jgi:carbon storage regulator
VYPHHFWVKNVVLDVQVGGRATDEKENEMLVLTRKPGQSIMIGDGVEVQVLSVAGEKVRLGITAPRDVSIFRDEVYDRIESEQGRGGGEDDDDEGANAAVAEALENLSRRS